MQTTKGFGTKPNAKNLIKNFRTNTRHLNACNIFEFVKHNRKVWDADYPNRQMTTLDSDELFQPGEVELNVNEKIGIVNPKFIGTQFHLSARRGFWGLLLITNPDGQKDFTFTVKVGDRWVFHPLEAKNNIARHHGEATYDEWRRLVKEDWKTQAPWLIAQAKKHCPDFQAYSVTCCDSSTRLMKSCPGIHVIEPGVAFLFT